jgi:hypothetical protein
MTHAMRAIAAILTIGLIGAAQPAAAQEEQSLQRHLERMIDNARQKLHNGLDGLSDEILRQLESFADEHGDITIMDESGNIIIERHWRRDEPKPFNPFEDKYEIPFGGIQT